MKREKKLREEMYKFYLKREIAHLWRDTQKGHPKRKVARLRWIGGIFTN